MGDLRVQPETAIGTDLPEGYRETKLGPLPEEWEVIKLEEAAGLVRGISWRKTEESPDGVPVVAIPNTHGGRVDFNVRYRISKNISSQKQLYEGNILLVGSSGSVHNVGRTAVVEEIPFPKATFASFLVKAEPSEGMDREFLYFLLRSSSIDFPACSKRAADGKYNLQVQALREHLVPLPPLSEQQSIAHVLRIIQKAIETTEQVIESTRELKRSLMNHLFTYGPVPVDEAEQVPLKETEIGSVPEHWNIVGVGELIAQGPQNGIYKPQSLYGEGTLIVRIDDFGNEGGIIDFASNSVQLSAKEIDKYCLNPSDILVNRVNSLSHLGKTTMVGEFYAPAVFESNMMRFTVNEDLAYPEYVARFLSSPIAREQMRGRAKRAVAQSSINQGDIRSILTPLPSLAHQEEILRVMRSVDSKTVAEESRKQSLEVLFKTLLHNLMTGRVRVKDLDLSEVEVVV